MIQSFRSKETERIWQEKGSRNLPSNIQRATLRKLLLLHSAERLEDLLMPPGNRLEQLKGKRAGQYSIRINDQWRICFVWKNGDAFEVECVDYH
jgi:toxin HigB-1